MLDLDAIEARAEAATPGPWTPEPVFDEHERDRPDLEHYWDDHSEWAYNAEPFRIEGPEVVENGEFSALSCPDADFIAASRADIPALVAELRAAREVVEAAEQWDAMERLLDRKHDDGSVTAADTQEAFATRIACWAALAAYRAVVGEQE